MTKAELEKRIAELEKENALLRDALVRVACFNEDDLLDGELQEMENLGLDVYPLIAGHMRGIARCAVKSLLGDGGEAL